MAEPVESGPDAGLRIDTIVKQYGRYPALRGVSLDVQPGEFVALLGPSGSGKTTLLRTLAGLETPDSGQVRLGGQDFLALSPRARRVGMVFQHYALFRHMTVASNIAFGLEVRPRRERPSKTEIAERVARLLALVQLEGLGARYPAQLSGGQRQRVALARALAIEPRLLLLDEPFGALDATVRKELRHHLRRIHDETGLTTLFVTHDQEEALDLADRVAVLREGRLLQVGAPRTLLDAPQSAFVHAFLGETNRLHGLARAGRVLIAGVPWLTPATTLADGPIVLFFRFHETEIVDPDQGLAVTLFAVHRKGGNVRLEGRDPRGQTVEIDRPLTEEGQYQPGQTLYVRPTVTRIYAEDPPPA